MPEERWLPVGIEESTMNAKDFALSKEQILEKYPQGSPDYPSHADGCGCSGCYASWCEWRGGHAAFELGVKEGERRALATSNKLRALLVREQLPCNDCSLFATWIWNHEYAMCDTHVPKDTPGWSEVTPIIREMIEGHRYNEQATIAAALEK